MDPSLWNNLLVYIATLVSMIILFLLRNKFQPTLLIVIWVYSIIFIETLDFILGLSPYDLYDFMDSPKYEIETALLHLFLYPTCSFIFLFFYEKWEIRGIKLAGYILLWLAFSLGVEWLAVQNGVLTYKKWKLLYSIPTYPIASGILIQVYHFAKKHLKYLDPQI